MKVIPFSDVAPADWDAVCANSRQAWLYHRSDWIALESRFFAQKNLSFALQDRSEIVAIQPLYLSECGIGAWTERLVHSGIHRHTGLAIADSISPKNSKAARGAVMQQMFAVAREHDSNRIQLNVQNLTPESLSCERQEIPFWTEEHGFYLGLNLGPQGLLPVPGMATCCADQIVDLSDSEDEIFARFEQRWAVRQGIKAGLEAEFEVGSKAIDAYYSLAELAAQRTGESLAPIEYYKEIWSRFSTEGGCAIIFACHQKRRIAGMFLILNKGAASYLGGVSDPDYLSMRVNDFLQWSGMLWMKRSGVRFYRLGPYFPEVPDDWPIARVSRFKKKFGGRSVTTIQGSYFLTPERYLQAGKEACAQRCTYTAGAISATKPKSVKNSSDAKLLVDASEQEAMAIVLSCYGLPNGTYSFSSQNAVTGRGSEVVFLTKGLYNLPGLNIQHETRHQYLYTKGQKKYWWHRAAQPSYRTLLPYATFSGADIEPIWVTDDGRAVVAWQRNSNGYRTLLIGLDVVAEIIRYRQGDPAKVDEEVERGGFGFDFERPNYLYHDQVDPAYPHFPWADMLGFMLAECIADMVGAPLLEPLPKGLKGLVVLTGDDDQAYLEKYAEQLACLGDLPITYFLVPQTRHTSETLKGLPKKVEIGVHPDALDHPENYDEICQEQTQFIRELSQQPVLTVRNHGFLNRGYLGHLSAWERAGLIADVNCPGTDGTALNGSLLPMRVRRLDGSWASHMSLLTAFGDGMLFGLKLSPSQSVRRIRRSVRMIEAGNPGALVFNLHPQNVKEARLLHLEAVKLARKPGWAAIQLGTFLEWSSARSLVTATRVGEDWKLSSLKPIESLAARVKTPNGRRKVILSTVTQSGVNVGVQS